MTDRTGTTNYTYDNRNHLQAKQTPFGTLNYTYDPAGNVLTINSSNAGGMSDTYRYDALNRLSTVTDAFGQTNYGYDDVGNLQSFAYPNGVSSTYNYDTLNRLTQVSSAAQSSPLASYTYTLGPAGNRLTVAELSGRNVVYGYDSLYRLTSETVSADSHGKNGAIGYTYDAVGNRLTLNATLPPAGGMMYSYDADDRLASEQYDANGNTTSSLGNSNAYDFENHLIGHNGVVNIVYDGDGNRVSETVGTVTTNYLVDTQNPTGHAQVVDELQNGAVTRTYSYGLERISETQPINSTATTSFYGYDGHGSVRFLTNSTGVITDGYDYDAFGNLVNQTGSTPNNYLFAGEQYDPALGLYYNRARYLNTTTGRFWSMDTEEGDDESPLSLHRYLYTQSNPVNGIDPSGHQDVVEEVVAATDSEIIDGTSTSAIATGTQIKETLEAVKLGLAALGIVYGALTPNSQFYGVTYDFQLRAITGGDFPDISFGLERRTENPYNPKGSTIIRVNCDQYRFRLKVGDNGGVSASGGLNIPLWSKDVLLGKLGINLGLRVSTNKTLSAQFEFRWALKGAPGVDPSGPVSGEAPEPNMPNQFGLAVRSKALIWDLTASPLSSGLTLGGESTF